MATILDQSKPAANGKYDAYVESYLARARSRIRTLDVVVALLGFLVGTLAYALVMALADRWWELPSLVRQGAFVAYLLGSGTYLAFALVLPLSRRLNPYWAARKMEEAVPGAKNSVVNWVDLHDRKLPAAIRGAIGQRAAKDLTQVNLERAISGRRAAWLGGATAGLFLCLFVVLILFSGRQFFSLMGRAFLPFTEVPIATRTVLTLVKPEGGDATVSVGQSVGIVVRVDGRVPEPGKEDALRLLLRYGQDEEYEERPLQHESGQEWFVTVPSFQVKNGFWYRIKGGDAQTPEYRISVRSTPLVTAHEVAYHYRPYLGFKDDASRDPNLKAWRGTEVTLTAHTNRTVLDAAGRVKGRLEVDVPSGKRLLPADPVEDDPQALRFKLTLDEDGTYRLWFTSVDGESNTEPMPYTIQVVRDLVPQVELKKPGHDVTLPANRLLPLEGLASDDHGLTGMKLQMKLVNGPAFQSKPYREGKSFQLDNGGFPRMLRYKDFVDLAQVKDADGQPLALQPKMVIEYWLEATDNCDHPRPNVGQSLHYKVTIVEADPDQKQQAQDRQQAQKDQKDHEAQQDKDLQQEGQKPREQQPPRDGDQKKPEDGKQPDGTDKNEKPDDKPDGKQENPDGKQGNHDPMDGDKPNENDAKQDDQVKKDLDKLKDAVKKNEEQKGQAKDDPKQEPKGENKDKDQADKKECNGQCKGNGQGQSQKPDAGQGKGSGEKQGEKKPDAGEGKGEGKDQAQDKGAGKGEPQAGKNAGTTKDDGQEKAGDPAESKAAAGGPGGDPDEKQGASKPPPEPEELRREPGGQAKGGGPDDPKQPKGDPKDDPKTLSRNENKESAKGNGGDNSPKGGAKDAGKPNAGDKVQKGEAKAGGADKEQDKGLAKADKKNDDSGEGGEGDKKEETKEQVDRLAKKAKGGKDGQEREKAERDLDKLSREAKDPKVREAARKAKDEAEQLRREREELKPAQAKENPDKDQDGKPCNGQCKNPGKGPGQNPNGSAKGGGPDDPKELSRAENKDKPDGADKAQAKKDPPPEENDGGANGGNGQRNPTDAASTDPGDKPAEGDPDPEHRRKAGELQLEDFKKKIDKRVLDDAKMTEEEYRRFLKAYADMLKRGVDPAAPEVLPDPQKGGTRTASGVKKVEPGKGKTADGKAINAGSAPPEFREAYREFSRKLAEPDK